MILPDLNLLPPSYKEKLGRLVSFLFIKNMLELSVITAAAIATILTWSWLVLIDDFANLTQSAVLIGREHSAQNQGVRLVNRNIHALNESGEGFYPLIEKILEIASTTPARIRLTAVNIDRETKTLLIAGVAQTRDDLLEYQNILQAIPWASPIAIPASQLLQKENISFQYQTALVGFPALRTIAPSAAVKRPANGAE